MSGQKTYPHFDPVTLEYVEAHGVSPRKVEKVDTPFFRDGGRKMTLHFEDNSKVTFRNENPEETRKQLAVAEVTLALRATGIGDWTRRDDGTLQPHRRINRSTFGLAPYCFSEERYSKYCEQAARNLKSWEKDYDRLSSLEQLSYGDNSYKYALCQTFGSEFLPGTYSESVARDRLPALVFGSTLTLGDQASLPPFLLWGQRFSTELCSLQSDRPVNLTDLDNYDKLKQVVSGAAAKALFPEPVKAQAISQSPEPIVPSRPAQLTREDKEKYRSGLDEGMARVLERAATIEAKFPKLETAPSEAVRKEPGVAGVVSAEWEKSADNILSSMQGNDFAAFKKMASELRDAHLGGPASASLSAQSAGSKGPAR